MEMRPLTSRPYHRSCAKRLASGLTTEKQQLPELFSRYSPASRRIRAFQGNKVGGSRSPLEGKAFARTCHSIRLEIRMAGRMMMMTLMMSCVCGSLIRSFDGGTHSVALRCQSRTQRLPGNFGGLVRNRRGFGRFQRLYGALLRRHPRTC
jgi:hypothetical protein